MTSAFGVIEISISISLQAHRKFVEMLSDLVIAVKALVEIGFTVAVQVVELNELIPTGYEYLTIDQFDTQGLE